MTHQNPDAPIDNDEWLAQEQGLARHRHGAEGQTTSQAEKSYAYLAESLSDQTPTNLPESFISDTAYWVATGQPKLDNETRRFERWMMLVLLAALGVALIVLSEAFLPVRLWIAHMPGWALLIAACLGVSACLPRKI